MVVWLLYNWILSRPNSDYSKCIIASTASYPNLRCSRLICNLYTLKLRVSINHPHNVRCEPLINSNHTESIDFNHWLFVIFGYSWSSRLFQYVTKPNHFWCLVIFGYKNKFTSIIIIYNNEFLNKNTFFSDFYEIKLLTKT